MYRIGIDLTQLQAGGQNGGVKPFIFEYVKWLGHQKKVPLQLVFLTQNASHAEVRALARFHDELVCLSPRSEATQVRSTVHSPKEKIWANPPRDLVRRLGLDVLYCPLGMVSWSCPGIPTIVGVVDVLHRDYPFTLPGCDVRFRESVFREMIRTADRIQGISDFTLQQVTQHYGFPVERQFRSYIAIHERFGRATDASEPTLTSLNKRYFLYPANAWPHKNHEVLLIAYNLYRSRAGTEAWDLVLTGHDDASMRSKLEVAQILGLGDSVRYLGHLAESTYKKIWCQAGALVFPSLYEGFGIPLVEAMAFGLPVITSKEGSLPEVGGEACLYVDAVKPHDLADAMYRIHGDPALRRDLIEKGKKRLSQFSFDQDARRFLDQLVESAGEAARPTTCGIHPDGWIGREAYFGTPASRNGIFKLVLRPMPISRKVRIEVDGEPFYEDTVAGGHERSIELPIGRRSRTVGIKVPDACNLNPADHRIHGLLIGSAQYISEDGVAFDYIPA